MALLSVLIDFHSIILLSGLALSIILLLLFLNNVRKSKRLLSKYNLLETENKSLHAELEHKNESLEEQITSKTKELLFEIENRKAIEIDRKIALKKAEEANFLKNAFLSNMSHEIRTPLNGIVGFSHLLLNEVEYLENHDLVDFAQAIAESSDRLLNLLEHIIDLSRIDANDYELKINTFEVNTVINGCIERFNNLAYQKGLTLEYKQDTIFWVQGDKAAFEKSVDLILDNAIKYTNTGSVQVSLQKELAKKSLRVQISDTGIGIDKSYLSAIFEAFRQENTGYSSIQQGAGLGLPLAQKLMLLMNGEIELESEKGIGTQVSLLLALGENNLSTDEYTYLSSQGESEIKNLDKKLPEIFIVEDDKMNRMVFKKMLSKTANLQIAIDGDDAFKQLESALKANKTFDLIFLDINLPAPWDGIILLKEFKKKWPILNRIPFIAQTAYAISGDKEKFLAEGFDDYISKPIDKKELFTIIENNIRKFSALRN